MPNGTGQAIGISQEVTLAKKLVIDKISKKFYSYELLDALPV
jgi:hypothetical protein